MEVRRQFQNKERRMEVLQEVTKEVKKRMEANNEITKDGSKVENN